MAHMMTSSAAASEAGRALIQGANQYVTFRCGASAYGLPIMAVREIRSWQPTTPIPGRPRASRGALNIRGAVVEVFDLAVLLGREPIEPGPGNVVLVLARDEEAIGLLVDSVSDIIQAGADDLMSAPLRSSNSAGARVGAMVESEGGLTGIIDLDSLFGSPA